MAYGIVGKNLISKEMRMFSSGLLMMMMIDPDCLAQRLYLVKDQTGVCEMCSWHVTCTNYSFLNLYFGILNILVTLAPVAWAFQIGNIGLIPRKTHSHNKKNIYFVFVLHSTFSNSVVDIAR